VPEPIKRRHALYSSFSVTLKSCVQRETGAVLFLPGSKIQNAMHTAEKRSISGSQVLNPELPGSMSIKEMAELACNQIRLLHGYDLGPAVGDICFFRDLFEDTRNYRRAINKVVTHILLNDSNNEFSMQDRDCLVMIQNWLSSVISDQKKVTGCRAWLVITPDPDQL
jgi:hypothetical protein